MNPKPHIFIHIPKTGGWTIRSLPYITSYVHHKLSEINTDKNVFKFAMIRNPYDRFLSAFSYYFQMDHKSPFWKLEADRQVALAVKKHSFESFVLNFENFEYKNRIHFQPQFPFTEGLDYLGRFETYKQSWFEICDQLEIPRHELPRTNTSRHEHWSTYYNNETLKIVNTLFKQDLDLFYSNFSIKL